MHRVIASSIVATAFASLAVVTPAADAPAIGSPPGGFIVAPGSVGRFTGLFFGACNSLTWGYQLNGGSNQTQFTFPGGCGSETAPNVTIGPFATPTSVRVFLTDNSCAITYYSDGTPVDHVIVVGSNPFTLRFADAGGFCEHKTTTLNNFPGCNFCVNLAITDQPIIASGGAVSTVEGASLSAAVASFTDPDSAATAGDYTATISWGDGNTSAGTITGASTFAVSGTHIYSDEGVYSISVTITDGDNPSNSAKVTSTAVVADAVLVARPACIATALGAYNGSTATFTDGAGAAGSASDFTASINWGDGSALTTGAVTGSGAGAYLVTGKHNYASTGLFTIKTTITDDGGSVAVASCTTIGFSFAPGGGAFVIGGQHAGLGQAVTFWGAQWSKANLAGAAASARSFKGFAESPASPTCGATWSSDTGNSTPPPAGPLPEFMGVVVTGAASQTGAGVTGKVVHIVVVKTNPGYAADPGHTGTGTVVAVVC